MNISIFYYSLLTLLILPLALYSQETTPDSLPTDKVEVLKRFDAVLAQTRKLKYSPVQEKIDTSKRSYEYDISVISAEIDQSKAVFDYIPLRQDDLYDPYHGIIKAGGGLPSHSYILGSAGFVRPTEISWNAFVEHKGVGDSDELLRFSSTSGGGFVETRISNDWFLTGQADIKYQKHQYFPLISDTLENPADADRKHLAITPRVGLSGYLGEWFLDSRWQVAFDDENVASQQIKMNLAGDLTRVWNDNTTLGFSLDGQVGQMELDTSASQLFKLQLQGEWQRLWQRGSSDIGFNLILGQNIFIYPDINLDLNLANKLVVLNLGVSGNARPLDLRSLLSRNPYLNTDQAIEAFPNHLQFNGGLKGKIDKYVYQISVSHALMNEQALFVNNNNSPHLFDVLIEDFGRTQLEGSLTSTWNEDMELGIRASKLFYFMENQGKPYHLPTYKFSIFSSLEFVDNKLCLHPVLNVQGGAAYLLDNSSSNLRPIVDLKFDMDYKFSDAWSMFIETDNLFNRANQRYHLYDAIGIQALIGIMYKL